MADTEIRYDNRYPDAFATVWTAGLAGLDLPAGREAQLMPLTRTFRRRAVKRTPRRWRRLCPCWRGSKSDTRRAVRAATT